MTIINENHIGQMVELVVPLSGYNMCFKLEKIDKNIVVLSHYKKGWRFIVGKNKVKLKYDTDTSCS